jgi:PST family polysaccharide transporter
MVTMAAQGAKFALTVLSQVALMRLLLPEDFGLVAPAAAVTGFLRVFKDAGLSTATIQREGITQAQVSNLFWVNIAVSAAAAGVAAALAPVVGWFCHDSRLIGVTLCLSVTFLISGSTVQHQALLNRQMRFKALALIEVGSMLVGLLTGVVMAWLGFGYWSLVGSSLAFESAGLALTWSASRWRPNLPARGCGTRSLLKFGVDLTAGTLVYYLARGSDVLLLKRYWGSDACGLYSRGTALLMRPLEQCLYPVASVFMPVLSRLQNQPERYRRTFLQVYEAMALASFPATGLFLALAHPLTIVLGGEKWEKAAPIFAAFTVAALVYPVLTIATWLFPSQGRGRDMLLASTLTSVLIVVAVAAGLPFGPVGVAAAFSFENLLVRLPLLYYLAGRRGPVSVADLWMGFLRFAPLWVVVFGVTTLTRRSLAEHSSLVQLLAGGCAGALACLVTVGIYPPARRTVSGLLDILRGFRTSAGQIEVRPSR